MTSRPRPILSVLGIFLIQLFANWTACSPITYNNHWTLGGSEPILANKSFIVKVVFIPRLTVKIKFNHFQAWRLITLS